jgi:hypothetical protein
MREGLLILCQNLSEKTLSQKTAQKSAKAQILEFAAQNSAKLANNERAKTEHRIQFFILKKKA